MDTPQKLEPSLSLGDEGKITKVRNTQIYMRYLNNSYLMKEAQVDTPYNVEPSLTLQEEVDKEKVNDMFQVA